MHPLCQACEIAPATVSENCDDPAAPYLLCASCHQRLLSRSLRPLEWYHLAKRHGWAQPLLHDDLYAEDGTADQPESDVIDAALFPIPTFTSVQDDAEKLLDWTITRWHLGAPEIAAWKAIPTEEKLRVLSQRFATSTSEDPRSVVIDILGHTGDPSAASFIRYLWTEYPAKFDLALLVHASATCMPFEEAFALATAALAELKPRNRIDTFYCLGHFASPAGLDWIEHHYFDPCTDAWGSLAAKCRPSWPRLTDWLSRGRPFSHIAIDTLRAIINLPEPKYQERVVWLESPPTRAELEATLRAFALLDAVPRVQQRIAGILENCERITMG